MGVRCKHRTLSIIVHPHDFLCIDFCNTEDIFINPEGHRVHKSSRVTLACPIYCYLSYVSEKLNVVSWSLKVWRKYEVGAPIQEYFTLLSFPICPLWNLLNCSASFPIRPWLPTAIVIYVLWVHTLNYHLIAIKTHQKGLHYIAYAWPALFTSFALTLRTQSFQV